MSEGSFGFLGNIFGRQAPGVQPKPSETGPIPVQEQDAWQQRTAVNLVKEGVRVPETRETAQREAAQEAERLTKMKAAARQELKQEKEK